MLQCPTYFISALVTTVCVENLANLWTEHHHQT